MRGYCCGVYCPPPPAGTSWHLAVQVAQRLVIQLQVPHAALACTRCRAGGAGVLQGESQPMRRGLTPHAPFPPPPASLRPSLLAPCRPPTVLNRRSTSSKSSNWVAESMLCTPCATAGPTAWSRSPLKPCCLLESNCSSARQQEKRSDSHQSAISWARPTGHSRARWRPRPPPPRRSPKGSQGLPGPSAPCALLLDRWRG